MVSMAMASTQQTDKAVEITYGIYTVERLPRGVKRSPKWDLHSIAKTKKMAEDHAKILSAQPYFDVIEVQEFHTCPQTQKRTAFKIKRYSRKSPLWVGYMLAGLIVALAVLYFIVA